MISEYLHRHYLQSVTVGRRWKSIGRRRLVSERCTIRSTKCHMPRGRYSAPVPQVCLALLVTTIS